MCEVSAGVRGLPHLATACFISFLTPRSTLEIAVPFPETAAPLLASRRIFLCTVSDGLARFLGERMESGFEARLCTNARVANDGLSGVLLRFIWASIWRSEIVALLQRFGRLESVRATFARLAASHLVLVALRRANDAAFSSGGSGCGQRRWPSGSSTMLAVLCFSLCV